MKNSIFFVCLFPLFTAAQNFHFSARLGVAGYQGDLKKNSVSISQGSLLGSLGVRYDLTENIALRSYFTLTTLKADDKKGNAGMKTRNLDFKTSLFEWEAGAQYIFLNPNYSWWIPYVYAGVGVYHYNPYTKDANGNKVFLHPLSTEGQGVVPGVSKYGLTQICIPFGVGVERWLNDDMRVGLELGYRKLFTDYLDDVSNVYADQAILFNAKGQQAVDLAYRGDEVGGGPYPPAGSIRGNKNNKDGYYYVALTYTIRYFFDKYKQIAGLPASRRNKKVGCPATRF